MMSKKTKEELRDWFAGQALSASCEMVSHGLCEGTLKFHDFASPNEVAEPVAAYAYSIADAMMAERAKTQEGGE